MIFRIAGGKIFENVADLIAKALRRDQTYAKISTRIPVAFMRKQNEDIS